MIIETSIGKDRTFVADFKDDSNETFKLELSNFELYYNITEKAKNAKTIQEVKLIYNECYIELAKKGFVQNASEVLRLNSELIELKEELKEANKKINNYKFDIKFFQITDIVLIVVVSALITYCIYH